MPFQLRVEFTGLCLYLVHADPPEGRQPGEELEASKVTVVIPECRMGVANARHPDRDNGKHHVGYMRLDLANLTGADARVPSAPDPDMPPAYEVVHRFTNQELAFGLDAEPSMRVFTNVPELGGYAPTLEPRPELFDDRAGELAVMRVTLTGGELTGEPVEDWKFSDLFSPGRNYAGRFAQVVTWTREVPGDSLTLTLTDFDRQDGQPAQEVRLTPVAGPDGAPTISLKIANLCCENPMEWQELESRGVIDKDEDFKWAYRVMQAASGPSIEQMLGTTGKFPIPVQDGPARGGEGCVGTTAVVRR